jgi:hypothetical protein
VELPKQNITVPACESCNRQKSRIDAYFRDVLITDIAGCEHPVAKELWDQKLVRALRKNHSEMMRDFVASSREVDLQTPSGLVVGSAQMAIGDERIFADIFRYLISGLYYYFERRVLPRNRVFRVKRLVGSGHDVAHEMFRQFGARKVVQLGGDVFRCKFQLTQDDPAYTFWFLSFFRGVNYIVFTPPKMPVPKILLRPRRPPVR